MKNKSVFLFAGLMLFSAISRAGQVEMAQWIPWSFLSQEVQKFPLNFQASRTEWALAVQGFNPKASELQIQLRGSLTDASFNAQGAELRSQDLSAILNIGSLSIDQTVVKDIGGNQIRIRVQAQCRPISIQISRFSIAAQARFVQSGDLWMPSLSGLQIQIPENSWSLSPVQCEGLQGLDSQILSQIQDVLKNPQSFQNLIKSWISPRINELWSRSWESLSQKNWQNLKVDSLGEPTDQGFFILGHMEVSGSGNIRLPSQLTSSASLKPQLILTSEGFEALAQESLSSFRIEKMDLQTVSSFSKLMHNRFLQIFVWPDLLNFSRKTPVWLSTEKNGKSLKLISRGMGQWQMQLQTRGLLEIPRKGESRKYIHWGLGLASNLITEVRDSQLTLTTQNAQSSFNWKFDDDYLQRFNPNTRISSTVLKQAAQGLFEDRKLQIQLPVLTWGTRTLKLNNWRESDSLILMDWE